ncbi:aldehyde ferredoxin oxidoreductase [Salinirubellus salinus]|uniref:Aldehyde ferredoxin oxidoreductase n=1 Tax=Salinirubellus salinus TaxID=1364945 RepID=A0A9E7R2Z6_9EURY|nr:aldehyde ferredoxin oxidoreductase C-terminal domain-containing protein [Salinirubellus salinus]UWM54611.1 aldehyde ferredoxin oxidoreductase [Salinirubellus salinus]
MSDAPSRMLRVDLSAERVVSETVPPSWRRRYLGGKGLGARYLYDELAPGTDPLGPGNALLFVLGPLTGALPGEQRYAAVTKSPLTGAFLDSYAGGTFPARLAGSLDDHLGVLVTGRAEAPVRLVVGDGDARVEPAETWGADAVETARQFPDASVACIGPAGENRVTFATIASDEAEHHAGRGGAGAVMGAKRLKAVVASGDPPAVPESVAALRDRDTGRFTESHTGRWLAASGTLETVDFADETGVLAARGWQERGFDGADDVGIDAAREAATGREHDGPVPGGFRVETAAGETVPRGATGMSLGAGLGIDEFDAVAELGEWCNRLGLDLIDGGNAVAWAARAVEAGLLDRDLSFGDPDGARALLGEIATRESRVGDALADGVAVAARRFGGEAFVPSVKEMSLPAYDPRGAASMALAYATSDRGGCHRRARPVEREVFDGPWDPDRAAEAVVAAQDARALRWSLVADDFAGEAVDVPAWLAAVGAPHGDLPRTGERVWTLVRLFNAREGFDRCDDSLPAVFAGDGGVDPSRFDAMLDAYYATRGWSEAGLPTRETLVRLGLDDVVDAATPVGDPGP